MFIGFLAAQAKFFIYDPIGDQGYKDSVSAALDVYIDLEEKALSPAKIFTIRQKSQLFRNCIIESIR